jgi:hypothetical protein
MRPVDSPVLLALLVVVLLAATPLVHYAARHRPLQGIRWPLGWRHRRKENSDQSHAPSVTDSHKPSPPMRT